MTPLLSKLTMCVCAAGTGAAIVPAAHAVHRHFAPHRAAVHRVVRTPVIEAADVRPDCLPGVTTAGDGLGGGGGDTLIALSPASAGAGLHGSGDFPFGGFGPSGGGSGNLPSEGGPGDTGPGGSTPGLPSTPGGPSTPSLPGPPLVPGLPPVTGLPPVPGIPIISNAPEPASWVLMVAGFGFAGGTMRYRRTGAA